MSLKYIRVSHVIGVCHTHVSYVVYLIMHDVALYANDTQ